MQLISLARLDALAAGLQRLPALLTATVGQVVQNNGHVLEDDNTAQLAAGLDSRSRTIEPEYADLTIDLKKAKGQPTDKVTLRDSGAFYTSIVAQVRGQQVELVGTDPKTNDLVGKYGAAILGLSDEAVAEFREDYVRPELEIKTCQALSL